MTALDTRPRLEALLTGIRALRPVLRQEQDATESRGHHAPAVEDELRALGAYRVLQPATRGGLGLGVTAYARMVVELARGCPSTGWCAGLAAFHSLLVAAHFDAEAQAELFGGAGELRAPYVVAPTGTCRLADHGAVITGRWAYASGVPYATHVLVNARTDDGTVVTAAVDRSECQVLDDWGGRRMLGLNGSGSNTVVIDEVLVPSHRITTIDWTAELRPGTAPHDDPTYLGRPAGILALGPVAVQAGIALAALDELDATCADRPDRFSAVAELADAAEGLVLHATDRYLDRCRRQVGGEPFTVEHDLRLRGLLQQASRLAWDAVELAFRSTGTRAARAGGRLERYYRDASTARTHPNVDVGQIAPRIGRAHAGLPLEEA